MNTQDDFSLLCKLPYKYFEDRKKLPLSGKSNFSDASRAPSGIIKHFCFVRMVHHLPPLVSGTHRTFETRQKCLLLVVSRHTITATKVIIKACIIHTCYHCLGARFGWKSKLLSGLLEACLLHCLPARVEKMGRDLQRHPNLALTSQWHNTMSPRPMDYKRQGSTDQSSIDFLDVSNKMLSFWGPCMLWPVMLFREII